MSELGQSVLPQPSAGGGRSRAPDEGDLVRRLRAGDEAAFVHVVEGWSPMMLRVARSYVSTDASAQEMVQEAWLAVVHGIARFEGRSSLRTWVFRILTNLAKTRGVQEARAVPWSSFGPGDGTGPVLDPERFRGADDEYAQHWTDPGRPWSWPPPPEDSALAGEIRAQLASALAVLPERQRTVVSLRDVHGLSADEVCATLGISAANQRVLLHRARAKLRVMLEDYYRGLETLVGARQVSRRDAVTVPVILDGNDIACLQVVDLLTDYLEGALSPVVHGAIEQHLVQCPNCSVYVDQIRENVRQMGQLPRAGLSPEACAELVRAFRRRTGAAPA